MGRALSAPDFLATLDYVHAFGRRLASWWAEDGFDILLSPVQAQPPPVLGYLRSVPEEPLGAFLRAAPYGVFTLPFNLSGQPAVSVPGHFTSDESGPAGLPIGVQLVAPYGDEFTLLDLAAQLERAKPWAGDKPTLFG